MVSLVFCGCNRHPEDDKGAPVAVFAAPADTVLATVGSRRVTVGDYRDLLGFQTALYRYKQTRGKSIPKDLEKRVERYAASCRGIVLPRLVQTALLDTYLEAHGACPDSAEAAKLIDGAVKALAPKRERSEGIEGLAKKIGIKPDYFKARISVDEKERVALLCFDPAVTNVSEREIDEGLARLDAYTARAVASNRVTWATCSNVLAQVKKPGADFAKIGRAVSFYEDEAEEWGYFTREELDNKELKAWAFAAKVGEIGGPFDLDDGLSIIKVLSHTEGTEFSSLASLNTEDVHLARISFAMVDEHPEPRTREHCRESLLEWKRDRARKSLYEQLFKETEIAYPNGAKLDFKTTKE